LPIIYDDPDLDGPGRDKDNDNDSDSSDEDEETHMDTTDKPVTHPNANVSSHVETTDTNSAPQQIIQNAAPTSDPQMSPTQAELPFPIPVLNDDHRHQSPHPVLFKPGMSKSARLEVAIDEIAALRAENKRLKEELDRSNTHCAMASDRIGDYHKRYNGRGQKAGKSTKLDLGSRWTTSGPGRVQFEVQLAEKKAKKAKKEEAQKKKEIAQAQKQAERLIKGPTLAFSGALSSKSKDDILKIVTALVIPLTSSKKYTKNDYIAEIKAHLDAHADELKSNPRFAGLYGGRGQRQATSVANADQENLPALPQVTAGPSAPRSFGTSIALNTATPVTYLPHYPTAQTHYHPYNSYTFSHNTGYNIPLEDTRQHPNDIALYNSHPYPSFQ
ncbi:hypothetical protein CVT25_014795, partial [Psilocybe cyanescens]